MLISDNPVLRAKALIDLTKRARNAIPLYLSVWVVLSVWADIPARAPSVFYLNLVILLIIAVVRAWHYWRVMTARDLDVERLGRFLVAVLLLSGLHWGVLSAWFVFNPDFMDVRDVFTVLLAAFAMGGTPILGISRAVRTWYPVFVLCPSFLASQLSATASSDVLSLFIVFALLYIYSTSRIVGADYHDAASNQLLAEERARRLEEQRSVDGLTGLKNRQYFDERFEQDWAMCARLGQPLSVLMIDIDHFKRLNDNHGHLCGDECLRSVASGIRAQLPRSTDTVARYGGEEFVALLPATGAVPAERLAQAVVDGVAQLQPRCAGTALRVTCSVGVATATPRRGDSPQTLLERADRALYRAKSDGRNRLEIARAA